MDTATNDCVLVTGGEGFVGRAVGKLLQGEGYRAVSLDCRAQSNAEEKSVQCDITDIAALQRVFEAHRFGGVIHLAAVLPTAAKREPLLATQANVTGTSNLLEMARRFGVRRFVFGSSLSVYGTCPVDSVVSETNRAAPEDLYGTSKLYGDQLGLAYCARHGLEFASLRFGRVVGPGSDSATSAWRSQIFEWLGAGDVREICIPYFGWERVLLVHLDDVARMLLRVLVAPRLKHAIYNAVCESVVVSDLKNVVEGLNSNLRIRLGEAAAAGNPRRLDSMRFQREFDFRAAPMVEKLRKAASAD